MTKDPRITAYALGEIGAAERERFEQEMAESDLLQGEVDAMLRLGKKLEALPKNTQRLDSATRERLIAEFAREQKTRRRKSFVVVLSATLGLAAAVALFAGLSNFDLGRLQSGSGPWANGAYYPGAENQKQLLPGKSELTKESSGQALRVQAMPAPKIETPEAAGGYSTYVVVEGDNLFTVAEKLGVTPGALLDENKIEDTANLPTGTVLKVPAKKNQRMRP